MTCRQGGAGLAICSPNGLGDRCLRASPGHPVQSSTQSRASYQGPEEPVRAVRISASQPPGPLAGLTTLRNLSLSLPSAVVRPPSAFSSPLAQLLPGAAPPYA